MGQLPWWGEFDNNDAEASSFVLHEKQGNREQFGHFDRLKLIVSQNRGKDQVHKPQPRIQPSFAVIQIAHWTQR